MAQDVEIYVRHCSTERLLDWVASLFGEVTLTFQADDVAMTVYQCWVQGNEVRVMLIPGIEDGTFTCISFVPMQHTPWRNDVECARRAARELGSEVRCDPVAIKPMAGPPEFLRIVEGREDYVNWWAETDGDG